MCAHSVKAYTCDYLRDEVTCLYSFFSLRKLDLNALFFALFPVNMKCADSTTYTCLISCFLWTLWGFVAAISTRSIRQLDLMTFSLRASQAQCSPHASLQQHIKHLCD